MNIKIDEMENSIIKWANGPKEGIERMENSKEDKIEREKFILGCVLINILNDDSNAFGIFFSSKFTPSCKVGLLARLGWEVELKELPEDIKERIKKTVEDAEKIDWSDKDQYEVLVNDWKTNVKEFTRKEVDENSDYRDSMEYYQMVNAELTNEGNSEMQESSISDYLK